MKHLTTIGFFITVIALSALIMEVRDINGRVADLDKRIQTLESNKMVEAGNSLNDLIKDFSN